MPEYSVVLVREGEKRTPSPQSLTILHSFSSAMAHLMDNTGFTYLTIHLSFSVLTHSGYSVS